MLRVSGGMKNTSAIFLCCAVCCAVAFMLMVAGCSQPAPSQSMPTTVPTTVTTAPLAETATPVPTTAAPTPLPTTPAPAVPLDKTFKDTPLLFTVAAPAGYAATTIRTKTDDYSIRYKTTIFNPALSGTNGTVNDNSGDYVELQDSLTIFSYSTSLSVDQDVRNVIRDSGAVSTESAVTYNGISYTRFDVASDPYAGIPGETIIFVGGKGSANENGFLPVMIYTLTPGGKLGM